MKIKPITILPQYNFGWYLDSTHQSPDFLRECKSDYRVHHTFPLYLLACEQHEWMCLLISLPVPTVDCCTVLICDFISLLFSLKKSEMSKTNEKEKKLALGNNSGCVSSSFTLYINLHSPRIFNPSSSSVERHNFHFTFTFCKSVMSICAWLCLCAVYKRTVNLYISEMHGNFTTESTKKTSIWPTIYCAVQILYSSLSHKCVY